MKKCKWIAYILLIAMTVTIFSQQVKINRQDSRIRMIENESSELFQLADMSATILLQLAVRLKKVSFQVRDLNKIVNNIQEINSNTIKKLVIPRILNIVNAIEILAERQGRVVNYISRNVDPKPFLAKLRITTVEVKVGKAGGAGTIIKVTDNYLYVLTAKHIVDCKGEIKVQVTDSKTVKFIKVIDIPRDNVYKSDEVDMAVIKVPKPEGSFIALDLAKDKPEIGEKIYTMGHPLSLGYTVQTGIVSNYTKRIFGNNKREYMMISAPAFNGNSGGACINCFNEVVGIVVGIAYVKKEGLFDDNEIFLPHLAFVVTIDDVNKFTEGLKIEETNSN